MKRLQHLTEPAIDALEQRGIDSELAARLGITSAAGRRGDDREWIACPHRETADAPAHWQFRTITGEKEFLSSTGTAEHRTFFNVAALLDKTLDNHRLIITEGQLDALAMMTAGFVRVLSVPDGAPGKETQSQGKAKYAYLEKYLPLLHACPEIVLACDDDDPGHALQRDLVARLGPERCRWVSYGGHKDANDLLLAAGPSVLVKAVESAKWTQLDGFYDNIDDVPPLPESEILSTGCPGLDQRWKLQRGRLTIVVGIPSHGKTTWLNDVMTEIVRLHDLVVAFASFEQYPNPEHRKNLRRCYLRRDPSAVTHSMLAEADDWIRRQFVFIVPSRDEPPTFDWLLDRARVAALRANAAILVIDPWNELAHENRPADIPMHEYVGVMLRKLRRFAQEYHIAVVVAVHPTKMHRDRVNGKSPIPTGYDCADSAMWVNRCDTGITIFRYLKKAATPIQSGISRTLVRNWKSRLQPELGRPGDSIFSFQELAGKFMFVPEEESISDD